jgi:serine/threonine-protein kinase
MADAVELTEGVEIAGAYRVLERLGRGGFGEVFLVEHTRTHRQLALKTLKTGLGQIEELRQRFRREAKAMSLLAHEGIVAVEDFGELEDGTLYLVMELARGQSLRDVIEAGPLEPPRAFAIAKLLLAALGAAHAEGVIHRDLKPDNVKIVPADHGGGERAKILDFGIAKLVSADGAPGGDTLTQAGLAFGTPDYMAPEQALGQKIDARADLYALGIILYEMLAGRRPFVADDPIAIARMQVAVDPPRLGVVARGGRTFSEATEAFVQRALAKRPDERFADAAAMADAMVAAEAGELVAAQGGPLARAATPPPVRAATPAPTLGTPPPRLATPLPARSEPPWWRRRPRRRLIAVGAGAAGVVLLVFAAITAGGGGSTSARSGMAALPTIAATGAEAPPSPLAEQAMKLLDAGDAQGAQALLEKELAAPAHERDARAYLALGHARAALGRSALALAAYERAAALAPGLGGDVRARTNLVAMLRGKDADTALGALEFLGARGGDGAADVIVEQASRGKWYAVRKRAVALAEQRGLGAKIDRLDQLTLDLQQAPSCPERRDAVLALKKLGDARALPALKRARGRRSGFFDTGHPNACLEKDASEAIDALDRKDLE